MRQVLMISTTVIAVAFVFAFLYHLSNGKEVSHVQRVAPVTQVSVPQPCPCDVNFTYFGWSTAAPAVRPPLRADVVVPVPPVAGYAQINANRANSHVPVVRQKNDVIAWNEANGNENATMKKR